MTKLLLAAAAAACLAATSAYASTGSVSGSGVALNWTTTNLETASAGHIPFDGGNGMVIVKWLPTTANTASFSAIVSASDSVPSSWVMTAQLGLVVDSPGALQPRLSYWHTESDFTLKRSDGVTVRSIHVDSASNPGNPNFLAGIPGENLDPDFDYLVTGQITFTPGHYLVPSTDPNCASLSCAEVRTDTWKISAELSTATIPEPASSALLLAGGILTLGYRRYRARTEIAA